VYGSPHPEHGLCMFPLPSNKEVIGCAAIGQTCLTIEERPAYMIGQYPVQLPKEGMGLHVVCRLGNP